MGTTLAGPRTQHLMILSTLQLSHSAAQKFLLIVANFSTSSTTNKYLLDLIKHTLQLEIDKSVINRSK